jgi:hypothetical protein
MIWDLIELEQMAKAKHPPKENVPPILAVDLDGTVLDYDGNCGKDKFGNRISGIVSELQKVRDAGWKIVVWTCRPVTPALKVHLKKNKIPYDYINDHPWNGDGPRKIHATVYLDDKGVSFNGNTTGLADQIINFAPWWRREK